MTRRPFIRWGARGISVSVDWCPLCCRPDTAHLARCVADCASEVVFAPVGQRALLSRQIAWSPR